MNRTFAPFHEYHGSPSDAGRRWRPLRAGLISAWRYTDEVLHFHNGRLVLVGPNGSGKSMALEFLVPLLFDCDPSPSRISAAGESRGRFADRFVGTKEQQTGFLWMEFGDGERTFSIGCRVRANRGKTANFDWFACFGTVGDDLHLLDPTTRVPVGRDRLREQAEQFDGNVFDHANREEYRRVVRKTLFAGATADQFDAIIHQMRVLRAQDLSKNLDASNLGQYLVQAQPPVNESHLSDVANGFRRLDDHKQEVDRLIGDRAAVVRLARVHENYAKTLIRVGADRYANAFYTRDAVTREHRLATEAHQTLREQIGDLEARLERASGQLDAVRAAETELHKNPAYVEGQRLDDLRVQADELAERAASELNLAVSDEAEVAAQRQTVAELRQAADIADGEVAAAKGGVDRLSVQVMASDAVVQMDDAERVGDARRLLREWSATLKMRIAAVQKALERLDKAVQSRQLRDEAVEELQGQVDAARAALREAGDVAEAHETQYVADLVYWAQSTLRLDGTMMAGKFAELDPVSVEAVGRIVQVAAERPREVLTERRAALQTRRSALQAARADLDAERGELESGEDRAPQPAGWRRDRSGLTGDPLWKLVDWFEDVDEAVRARVESALTSAGLLDGWVNVDGSVRIDGADHYLDGSVPQRPGRTLSDLLVPVEQDAVPTEVVARILSAVHLDTDESDGFSVNVDGQWRAGPLVGFAPRIDAQFIGATARAQARQRRLAEIADEVDSIDADLQRCVLDGQAIDNDASLLTAEANDVPDADALLHARQVANEAQTRHDVVSGQYRDAKSKQSVAQNEVREAQRDLSRAAADNGLPARREQLVALEEQRDRFFDLADVWLRRRDRATAAWGQVVREEQQLGRLETRAATSRARADAVQREAATIALLRDELASTVGASYLELQQKLVELSERSSEHQATIKLTTDELSSSRVKLGRAEETVSQADDRRKDAESGLTAAQARLISLVRAGFLSAASLGDVEVSDERGRLRAASTEIRDRLAEVSGDPDARIRKHERDLAEGRHHALQSMSGRYDLLAEEDDDYGWMLLRASSNGSTIPIQQLVEAVDLELEQTRADLDEEERRTFHDILTGKIRRHLADLIRRAKDQVDATNEQLAQVMTAAGGVGCQLAWDVEPNMPEITNIRSMLLEPENDRNEQLLHDFFRRRIDEVTETSEGAEWEEKLRMVLDYRTWHRFTLKVAHAHRWEGLRPMTSSGLGLSAGESAMVAFLPMLASIASLYSSVASPETGWPRLVAFDELFHKVDQANRALLFSTITAWQLDGFYTTELDQCTYATLDGISIHSMQTDDDSAYTTRRTWDGATLTAGV